MANRQGFRVVYGPQRSGLAYAQAVVRQFRLVFLFAKKTLLDFVQQTVFGYWWLAMRALLPTVGIVVIFQNFEIFQTEDLPYGLYVISGMTLFSGFNIGLRRGIRGMNQLRRVAGARVFPRLLMPISQLVYPILYMSVFVVALPVTIAGYSYFDQTLYLNTSPALLLTPVFMVLVLVLICAISTIGGLVFMIARDVRFILPMVSQAMLILSPIIYPLSALPDPLRMAILFLNPMAPLIEAFRWSLFGGVFAYPLALAVSIAGTLFLFGLAGWLMMRAEWVLDEVV